MTRELILEKLMEQELVDKDEYVILADGFEDAFMGVTTNKPIRAVYNYWKCLELLMKDEDADFDESIDWLDEFIKEDFLEKLGEGDEKNRKLFEKLLKITGNLHILNKEKELIFIKDKEIICFSKTLKSRLEIVFPIRGESVQFNPKLEKVRGSEIFIELKDNLEIWKIIEDRIKI